MKKILAILSVIVLTIVLVACGNNSSLDIKVYTRDTSSGTRGAFFEIVGLVDLVASDEGLVEGAVQVAGNGDMISSVKNDKNGIGYISLASLDENLKALNYGGISASEANVLNNTYELKRPFMYIQKDLEDISDADEKALLEAFVAFMGSRDGLEIIKNNDGIVEIPTSAKTWDQLKADYPITAVTGAKITIRFGGSTSVEKIARALSTAFTPLALRFQAEHSHSGSSSAFTGTRADGTLHMGFASRELKTAEKASINGRLAYDAVVIVVNKENDYITNITQQQVQDIFTGKATTWEDLKQ